VLKSVPKSHMFHHVKGVPGFEGVIKHRPRGGDGRQVRGYLGLRPRTQEEKAALEDETD
jgi:hypothetical protein